MRNPIPGTESDNNNALIADTPPAADLAIQMNAQLKCRIDNGICGPGIKPNKYRLIKYSNISSNEKNTVYCKKDAGNTFSCTQCILDKSHPDFLLETDFNTYIRP